MTASLPVLIPRLLLGLETEVQGNIHFITDDEIVYPVGTVIALHDFNDKKQKFIKLADKGKNLTHIALSPNKKLIAVVETADKFPICTLWCADTFRKKKVLTLPTDKDLIPSGRYVAAEFTFDSKHIILVAGDPDWNLYCFKCEKGRLESFGRAINMNGVGTVNQVACNPNDANQLAVVGDSVLRCLGCQDFNWRQFGYNKFEPIVYTSACWLSQDRLVVGTSTGKVLILDTGELRAVFNARELPLINMRLKEEMEESSQDSLKTASVETMQNIDTTENYEIRSIVNFPRGFAFGFTNGKIHFYEKENPNKFRKRYVFIIPDQSKTDEFEEGPTEKKTTVHCIRVNPSQDRIIATCGETQIYSARLWLPDVNEVVMQEFGYPLHMGPVKAITVCRWKPIAITIGAKDRSLKIWNYETDDLELVQNFEDDLYCVALHPSGLYTVLGFSDKLRYMTILIDEIVTTKEFGIRGCALASFSNMGHVFAATDVNIIVIFTSIGFNMLHVLKGHNGQVKSLSWNYDDTILASCGSEGAVYLWNVVEATRVAEVIIKSNPFSGVAISSQAKECYAIGMDGHVRCLAGSNIDRDVVLVHHNVGLQAVILSQLDTMLFVTGNEGVIYSIKLPLMEKAEYIEFCMQRRTITCMCMTFDDRYLITGGVDGSLCTWKLSNTEDKALKLDKEIEGASEILISNQMWQDNFDLIQNLQARLKELETEHLYQMRQNDALHSLKMKDIHAEYCHAIEELKIKNEQIEADHILEINNINAQILKMKADHEVFIQNMETNFNKKLMTEYEKYERFEEVMNSMLRDREQAFDDLKKAKQLSEDTMNKDYTDIIKEKDIQIDELKERWAKQIKEHEDIKAQIEDDCDREIYELKTSHEKELKEEQDLNVRLRSEAAVVKKKYLASQKETEDYKHRVGVLENDQKKLRGLIANLEKDIVDIKKEIQERDSTIEEKEKRIFQLKSKNQELEKFKFILDFKIKELKSQIEPRERTIRDQIIQIAEMVRELETLQNVTLNMNTHLSEQKSKFASANGEIRKQIEKNVRMKKALQRIRIDLHHASGFVQNVPMLQKCVKDMYHKYNADKDFEVTQAEDTEAKNEFLRQRDFLERTVATLHTQATKNTSTLSYDKIRLVEENAALLVETNHLRKNLRAEINQNKSLNSIIGMTYTAPKLAQKKLSLAVSTNEEIHNKYKKQLDENYKTIQVLKEENERLVQKLSTDVDMDSQRQRASSSS